MFCPRLLEVRIRSISKFIIRLVNDGFQNSAVCNVDEQKCCSRKVIRWELEKRRSFSDVFHLITLKNLTGNLNKNCKSDPDLIRLHPEEASRTLLTPSTEFHLKIILKFKFGFLLCCLSVNLGTQYLSTQNEQS